MDLLIAPNTVTQAQSDQAPATGTPGWATDGNPTTNTPATIFPAYAFNAIQAELTAAIQGAGITLDRTKLNQLASALQKMTQGASAVTAADTGVANAYAVTLNPAPLALTPGMMVAIDNIVASNTGGSTLNVNGLGTLPIQSAGAVALQGGELVAGYGAMLRLNHAGTAWTLLQTTGGALPVKPANKTEHAINLGQFPASIASSGYVKFSVSNGGSLTSLILQWGAASSSTSGVVNSFPLAFPNGAFSVVVTAQQGNPVGQYVDVSNAGPTGFTATSNGGSPPVYYIAIGY